MSETKKFPIKLIVGGVAIVAILGILYFFLFSGDSVNTSPSLQVASSTTNANSAGNSSGDAAIDTDRILRQLNNLRRIQIRTDLFDSQAFLNLLDFSINISPQNIGRENPFIPSTYTPSGPSIMPRANPAMLQPISSDNQSSTNTATTTEDSATTSPGETTEADSSTSTSSDTDDVTGS